MRVPFTVEASTSPLASRTVTEPFTASACTRLAGLVTSTLPLTLCRSTSFEPPVMLMLPFTVSAVTGPFTPSMRMVEAKPSISSRLSGGDLDLEVRAHGVGIAVGLYRDGGAVGAAVELQPLGPGAERCP